MSISTASTFTIDQRSLPGNKWLNVVALAEAALSSTSKIVAVNYYTARVSGRVDPTAPARQHAYLRALESLPLVKIHYGNFPSYQKWFGLVQPPMFRPECTTPPDPTPQVAYVWKMEEKGSDVNLGVHLVRDAFLKTFDEAAILTNDTDLAEPVRIVAQELNLQVTLLTPAVQSRQHPLPDMQAMSGTSRLTLAPASSRTPWFSPTAAKSPSRQDGSPAGSAPARAVSLASRIITFLASHRSTLRPVLNLRPRSATPPKGGSFFRQSLVWTRHAV